jgi:hypothetical protein
MSLCLYCPPCSGKMKCGCRQVIDGMRNPRAVGPRLKAGSRIVQETFYIEGSHYFVEEWGLMEFRALILELHDKASIYLGEKRVFKCRWYGEMKQKHRINVYRHHGCPRHVGRLKAYPTIPWPSVKKAITLLKMAVNKSLLVAIFTKGLYKLDSAEEPRFASLTAQRNAESSSWERVRATHLQSEKPRVSNLRPISSRPPRPTGTPTSSKRKDALSGADGTARERQAKQYRRCSEKEEAAVTTDAEKEENVIGDSPPRQESEASSPQVYRRKESSSKLAPQMTTTTLYLTRCISGRRRRTNLVGTADRSRLRQWKMLEFRKATKIGGLGVMSCWR